jgi:hypothetical protein
LVLIDIENDLSYQCQTCENFVACLGCIKQETRPLFPHPSDHHFIPDKPFSNTHWMKRNLAITCNLCGEKHFFGKCYQCRQCSDYNVCSNCLSEAQQSHCSSQQHTFTYVPNPTKIHSNRALLADRTVKMLQYRNAGSTHRDEITGWTLTEAEIISADENKNYLAAWKEASQISEDDDINFIPSIIEHAKIELPSVLITIN